MFFYLPFLLYTGNDRTQAPRKIYSLLIILYIRNLIATIPYTAKPETFMDQFYNSRDEVSSRTFVWKAIKLILTLLSFVVSFVSAHHLRVVPI